MTELRKPILCIDFDGVIHSYEKGWQDGKIYGHVTDGFFQWAEEASKFFKLVIYSSRSGETSKRFDMDNWMKKQQGEKYKHLEFEYASEKPPAFLTIDDRCIRFDGDWSTLDPNALINFKPWMHNL